MLAAAIDPRIKLSISVAGSMPIYARRFYPGSMGDTEQFLPALYNDRAGYLDLYTLDAYGKGRRHIQINNQYDSCCFYGVSHTTWVDNVKKAVTATGAGTYDFYLDSTHRQHQISDHAIEKLIDPALGIHTSTGKPAVTGKANYERPFEPPTRSALIPLPPGAIEPAGWLRDWCISAKDGYTGHMDEVDIAFRQAWASDYKMTGEKLNYWDKGGWPYEGGGYWFEGLAKLGFVLHDDALINQAKRRLYAVADNMNPNSILFLWWLDKNKPEDLQSAEGQGAARIRSGPCGPTDSWAARWSVISPARAIHRILKTLETAYSGNPDWVVLGWSMSNPWPAFETYTWTGNKVIKEALTAVFTKGGNNNGECSWNRYRRPPSDKPGAEPADHGVHFCESTAPWALGYLWTGKREFLDAAAQMARQDRTRVHAAARRARVRRVLWPARGISRHGNLRCGGLYVEQHLLLTISGQARLADRIERAFFNAAPATVARDFKTHVYMQSPNRIADKSLPAEELYTYATSIAPMCCTAALNRFLPNYVMNMWMATRDNGLAAVCYGPCKVSALVADHVPVEIICKTDYPFNETIEITVNPAREAKFPLSFRIPGWCKYPGLELNGEYMKASPDAKGFVRIERLWKPDDKIQLRFPHVSPGRHGPRRECGQCPLCLGIVRAASVRLADCRHEGCEHARPGGEVAIRSRCAGRHCEPRLRRRTRPNARQMELALGVAAKTPRSRGEHRLETNAQRTTAIETVRRRKAAGVDHACSLRLHEVPCFDVAGHQMDVRDAGPP